MCLLSRTPESNESGCKRPQGAGMDRWPGLEVGCRDKDLKAAMDAGCSCLYNTPPDPFNSHENLNLGQENRTLNG